jgi:hypothetical protein
MDRIIREAIEAVLHPFIMKKEDGFRISRLCNYFIFSLELPGREPVSTKLCGPYNISTLLDSLSLNFPLPSPCISYFATVVNSHISNVR